jgi:L-ascorbate metabolism protein UlaG (beta-lactamase superfamily)
VHEITPTPEIHSTDRVFVADNTAIEPLIDRWYAWTHLINPATAALNIKNRHLSIMNSYIQYPQVHATAVKRPELLGGPFIDYDGKRVDEIEALRNSTLKKCEMLIDLAANITQLYAILLAEGKGYGLAPLIEKIPEKLKGLVELYYDINNNPSFRFFEPLLYQSEFYLDSLQSINLLSVFDDDSRSFVLSTPRLWDDKIIHREIPFDDDRIDVLFRSRNEGLLFSELSSMFEIKPEETDAFKRLFTKTSPKKYKPYNGDGILTRYFGHACIFIETRDVNILVDPLISYVYDSEVARYTFADLPDKIDFVLITHNHQDHVLFETLLRIRHKVQQVIVPRNNGGELQDPSLKLVFEKLGFKNVIELNDMETLHFSNCSITGIPFIGEHSDLNIRSKSCFLVNFQQRIKMLFAADSCNYDARLYERIEKIVGNIDVIFLGMECDGAPLTWVYGPLLPRPIDKDKDQTRRLAGSNFFQAKSLIDIFKPKEVFVYAMGMEPWLKFISSIKYTDESRPIKESNELVKYCQQKGITAQRLFGEKILEYR